MIVPGTNLALSIESYETGARPVLIEAFRPPVRSFRGNGSISRSSGRVGVVESPSAVPHEGQDCLSSGMSCKQEGHFVMGGRLYHPVACQLNEIDDAGVIPQ